MGVIGAEPFSSVSLPKVNFTLCGSREEEIAIVVKSDDSDGSFVSLEHQWSHLLMELNRQYMMQMNKEQQLQHEIRNAKVKEGFLFQRSRLLKQWKRRWIVLTRTCLYSFEHQEVYKKPTEKIPLKDISTVKSFYKNQYDRSQVFRVESDDTYFYLSTSDHQEKWAWVTGIQKTTEMIRNPGLRDTQNLVRESLKMTSAANQSLPPRQSVNRKSKNDKNHQNQDISADFLKKLKLSLQSHTNQTHIPPFHSSFDHFTVQKLHPVSIPGERMEKGWPTSSPLIPDLGEKMLEKVVEKIVEIQVPVDRIVERKVEVQKIVYVQDQALLQHCSLIELFSTLISGQLKDPRPLLDFVAFLTLTGVEKYQNAALQFCCNETTQRFFAELVLQAVNEQIGEERLNNIMGFVYVVCEREPDFFYASDMKILVQIVLRQLQLYRSDLNQMINLRVLKVLLSYHLSILEHKVEDIQVMVEEIVNFGHDQNQELAAEVLMLIN